MKFLRTIRFDETDTRVFERAAAPGAWSVPGGFALGRAVADEAELLTLAVAPGDRRHGIGTGLLADFLAEARERGAVTMFLEVAADNVAALALYRRHGFSEAGRRRGYYRDSPTHAVDAIVMRRRILPEPDGN